MKETQGQARVIAAAARGRARARARTRVVSSSRAARGALTLHRFYTRSPTYRLSLSTGCAIDSRYRNRVFLRGGFPLRQGRVNDPERQSSRRVASRRVQ